LSIAQLAKLRVENMSELRHTGINRSLHRPNLMAGGERIPVLLVGLITFALIAAIKTLPSIRATPRIFLTFFCVWKNAICGFAIIFYLSVI
jgi:type IV secretory pathway TrbD component